MSWSEVTRYFLVVVFLLVVAYDVFVALRSGPDDTITWQVRDLSRRYLIIPFAIGAVCGHLFWSD